MSDMTKFKTIAVVVAVVAFTVTVFAIAKPVPLCEFEDGSGQEMCMWDASREGNGIGSDVFYYHGHAIGM